MLVDIQDVEPNLWYDISKKKNKKRKWEKIKIKCVNSPEHIYMSSAKSFPLTLFKMVLLPMLLAKKIPSMFNIIKYGQVLTEILH